MNHNSFLFEQESELGGQKFIISGDTLIIINKFGKMKDRPIRIKISEIDSNYIIKRRIYGMFWAFNILYISIILLIAFGFLKYVVPDDWRESMVLFDFVFVFLVIVCLSVYISAYAYPRCRPLEVTCFKNKQGELLFEIIRPFSKWWEYDEFLKIISTASRSIEGLEGQKRGQVT